jgi:hypothetical protein
MTIGLDTGLGDSDAFEHQLEEFASIFDLQMKHHRATLRIVEKSYKEAKKFLSDPPM